MVKGRLRWIGEDRNVLESLSRKTDLRTSDMAVDKGSCSISSVTRTERDVLRDAHPTTVQSREGRMNGSKENCDTKSEVARCKGDIYQEMVQVDWIDDIPSCPVYYPNKEEFADPLHYLESIAPEASKYGMCKIVSPLVVSVPAGTVLTKERVNFKFTTRLQPTRLANWDADDKITFPESHRMYSLVDYEKMANRAFSRKFSTAANLPTRFVETEFWKELMSGNSGYVEYACDVDGSAFSMSDIDPLGQSKWNLNHFSRLPKSILHHLEKPIPGVTEPMLYIGMLFSMFAWHVEDHYLYSINYHHCGAPKTWYGVPGHAASDFESVVQEHVYSSEMQKNAVKGLAYDLLIGKTTMFAPKSLSEHGVPVYRAVQRPGEFVITFPRAYHAGFSHGFNCGEAVNFATADWFPYGAAACRRYELLNRDPLLSHEELLCKEALLIPLASVIPQKVTGLLDDHQRSVKGSFLEVMRFQHQVHWFIKKQGAQTIKSDVANLLCSICKHVCYVSYVMCKCYPEPMCLNHGREIHNCACGKERLLFTAVNLTELQARAQKFENEKGVLQEVSEGPSILDPSTAEIRSIEKNMLQCDAYDSYVPFCDINAKEIENIELLSNEPSVSNVVQVEAVAPTDSPVDEKSFFSSRTSLEISKSSERELSRMQKGEDGPKSCSSPAGSEISCTVASPNGKQVEVEEESDSEAFRVKRRRVAPPCIRKSNTDAQETKPKRLKIIMSQEKNAAEGLSEKGQEKGKDRTVVREGYQVLVRDIIHELGLKGTVDEVTHLWQVKARHNGMILKVRRAAVKNEMCDVLSSKSCSALKKLLPEGEKLKLEQLMKQASRKLQSSMSHVKQVHACGNALPEKLLVEKQCNAHEASSLTCRELKSCTAVHTNKQISMILSESGKPKEGIKAHAGDPCAKRELGNETVLAKEKRKRNDASLIFNPSAREAVQKTCDFPNVDGPVQAHPVQNLKIKKQKVNHGNTKTEYSSIGAFEFEGARQVTLLGVSAKYSKSQGQYHSQRIGCLKVKGPSPPAVISENFYKVKRKISDIESKKDGAEDQISKQTHSNQCTDHGLHLPVEKCPQQVMKGTGSTGDMKLKCHKYSEKARTAVSEVEPKRGLSINVTRKVETSGKSLISHAAVGQEKDEVGQKKDEVTIATSNSLNERKSVNQKVKTVWLLNQKNASPLSSNCLEGSSPAAKDSCFNQDNASGCTALNVLKDNATATGKGCDKSDPPCENVLEKQQLIDRESRVNLANKDSGRGSCEDALLTGQTAAPTFQHANESLCVNNREHNKHTERSLSALDSSERNPNLGVFPWPRDGSLNVKSTDSVLMDCGSSALLNDEKVRAYETEDIQKDVDPSCLVNNVAKSSCPIESTKNASHHGQQPQKESVQCENLGEHSVEIFHSDGILGQWHLENSDKTQDRVDWFSHTLGPESEKVSRAGSENISVNAMGVKKAGHSFYVGEVPNRSPSVCPFKEIEEQTGAKLGLYSGQKTKTTPLGGVRVGEGGIVHGCEQPGFCPDVFPAAVANNGKDMGPFIRDRDSSAVVRNDNQRGLYFPRPALHNVQFKRNGFHHQRHHHSFVDRGRSFKHPEVSFYQTKERGPYVSQIVRPQGSLREGWGTDGIETKGFLNKGPVDSTEAGHYHYSDGYNVPAWRSSLSPSSRHWQYRPAQVQTPNVKTSSRRSHLHSAKPLKALSAYNFEGVYGRQ